MSEIKPICMRCGYCCRGFFAVIPKNETSNLSEDYLDQLDYSEQMDYIDNIKYANCCPPFQGCHPYCNHFWDTTFPFFWIIRKAYLCMMKKPSSDNRNKKNRTIKSGLEASWKSGFSNDKLISTRLIWLPIYFVQYYFFRNYIDNGFSMIAVAKKNKIS